MRYVVAVASFVWMIVCADPRIATAANTPPPSVQVETASAVRKTLNEEIKAYGTVTVGTQVLQDITFPRAGQISRLDVRSGEQVRAGQPLVELTEGAAAQASYENAKAALDFARRDLAKLEHLRQQHFATNVQVAAAQKKVDDAKVALDTERRLGTSELTTIAKAPFDGFVSSLAIAAGDRVQAGASLMKIARTDRATAITAGLEPEDASRTRPGMEARVTPVFASSSKPLPGKVRGVSATADPATKLINAWIDLDDVSVKLAPGTNVTVSIIVAQHQGITVPRKAVLHDAKGAYLFEVTGGSAHRVPVKVGIQTDTETEIIGSVELANPVIVAGAHELKDGMAVRQADPASKAK
jgi:RND family efflux transporter MFP subunit